jgi:hypothetical protein
MRNISKEHFIATNVLIEFEDGPVSVRIPHGATLADISENLDQIGKWHRGHPLSIDVCFKAPEDDGRSRASAHPLISSSISPRLHRERVRPHPDRSRPAPRHISPWDRFWRS